TMNQKSSLRKIPLFVSQALTANSVRWTYQLAMRLSLPGLPRHAGHRIEMRHVDPLRADV
ncbi:hypothetical protein QJT79_45940, partial [Bradyrhizobium sp. Mp64]|nr:hypothetical protein [Bradyrhizobium sp. Mp64]